MQVFLTFFDISFRCSLKKTITIIYGVIFLNWAFMVWLRSEIKLLVLYLVVVILSLNSWCFYFEKYTRFLSLLFNICDCPCRQLRNVGLYLKRQISLQLIQFFQVIKCSCLLFQWVAKFWTIAVALLFHNSKLPFKNSSLKSVSP